MYCNACGKAIPDGGIVCSYCGKPVAGAAAAPRQLVRPRQGRRIAGVAAGLAQFYGWDLTLLRVVWVLLFLFGGVGLLPYVVLWIVMPNE